ncbi:bro-g [Hyphantria cunea granulovirus]|uniref:Bro-g n=1 Tax=Hyphantria cunea granulovirus TaxID=307448 RepID=A0AAF1D2B4_9BBAC|nr:bro-g [Hyphantria cunea granulovirus]QBQ01671.1 bro-g [Hyphantria cunea granulovirus]
MALHRVNFADRAIEVYSVIKNDERWYLTNPFMRVLNVKNIFDQIVSRTNQKCLEELNVSAPFLHPKTKLINDRGLQEMVWCSPSQYAREFKHYVVNVVFPSLYLNPIKDFEQWREEEENARTMAIVSSSQTKPAAGFFIIATNDILKRSGFYKIFCTQDVDSTLEDLNVASPYDFWIVYRVYSDNCEELKNVVHKNFALHKIKRDFYILNKHRLDDLIDCLLNNGGDDSDE